jgi:hypothetical protein
MRKRVKLEEAFAARLDAWRSPAANVPAGTRLLVVAGPYGAGKSKLAAEIAEGVLPEGIAELLPAEAPRWPQTSGRKAFSAPRPAPDDASGGLILHYNILRPALSRVSSYASDPILDALDLAGNAVVLTLRPPLPRLVKQFVERSLVEQADVSPYARLRRVVASAFGTRAAARNPPAVTPEPAEAASLTGRYARVYRLYQEPGWLDGWYVRWADYLTAKEREDRVEVRWLEPARPAAGGSSFRTIAPPSVAMEGRSRSGARTPP